MRSWFLASVALATLAIQTPADARPLRMAAMDGEVVQFYGKINPFYGKINPFYGKISPFWGDITPFWGDIDPFYGKITPFYGSMDAFWGAESPFAHNTFWGTVQPFWTDMGPKWGDINTYWQSLQDTNGAVDYSTLQQQLRAYFGQMRTFWAPAMPKGKGAQNFSDFVSPVFSKYGINPDDPASLAAATPAARSALFLSLYDRLMDLTGVDHVDWWMPAVHWTPSLTQIEASDHPVKIGILDSTLSNADDSIQHIKFVGGFKVYSGGHGAAVASLISAQHDGVGVMGIAPQSEVDLYNPFDASGTADWSDIQKGINALYAKGVHVVNLSLGVPGTVFSSEWANVMTGLHMNPNQILFVKAAGNEGVMQTTDVSWGLLGLSVPQNLILVGSVGPTEQISDFSNRPGEACFTLVLGLICSEENKLKYHFLVAPGELMLVSDNAGGVTRMSGTSFAAPLVTGAVALLDTRWPWLGEHSAETAQIIFQSADDLGAPGVDPVYGWGMLNIEASQSPLDFNKLVVYRPAIWKDKQDFRTINGLPWSPTALKAAVLAPGQLDLWQSQKAFVIAIENIGSTYRDFSIPLSSMLVGKNQKINGAPNQFQSYLYRRMTDWANGGGFADFASTSSQLRDGEWSLSMAATPSTDAERQNGAGPFHSEFVVTNKNAGVSLSMGEGSGAHALGSHSSLSLASDFDPATGGFNPVLGFASGGAYAKSAVTFGDLRISAGFTNKSDDHSYLDPTYGELRIVPLSPYVATASVFGVDYAIADGVTLNASYTRLNEANGLLGGQGSGALSFSGGSTTQAFTCGATASFEGGWELSGSATMARTAATQFNRSPLSIEGSGIAATAFEFAALKTGVFGERDRMRFSVAQPLHVENGSLRYTSLQVVDRDTGELGSMVQHWNVADPNREYRAEAIYAAPIMDGRAEVSGFARLDLNGSNAAGGPADVSVGARFRLNF